MRDYSDTADLSEFTFSSPPRAVGGYDLGAVTLMLTKRPHWVARFLCRWLLDWRWVEHPALSGEP